MKLIHPTSCAIILGLTTFAAHAEGLKIVAAENFYGGVAEQISGGKVSSILTNPNQDPHDFTSNAGTAKSVADADVVIYSGIGYDTWMEKLLGTPGKSHRVVINVSVLIGGRDGDNPHIWYDPRTMPALGARLVEVLSQLNPDQASAYRKRLDDFKASMKPELDKIAEIKASSAGLEVTATEPVFGYLATALGFKMLNYDFQVQVMNDAEPTVTQTADFERSLTTQAAKILFYNSQVTNPTTDRIQKIARQAGISVVGVTETRPLDEENYVGWMMHELERIQAAVPSKGA